MCPHSLWGTYWMMFAPKFWEALCHPSRIEDMCPILSGGFVPLKSWKSRALVPTIPIGRLIGGCVPLGDLGPPPSPMRMCTPKFLRVYVPRFWEECALIPFGGLIGGYVPLYLGGIVPPSFPNERCVSQNSGGFVPPTSGRIVPLSPL